MQLFSMLLEADAENRTHRIRTLQAMTNKCMLCVETKKDLHEGSVFGVSLEVSADDMNLSLLSGVKWIC